jgi:hypothetical protein
MNSDLYYRHEKNLMHLTNHLLSNLLLYVFVSFAYPVSSTDLFLLMGANIIDIDHLFARPIYNPLRSSFTHILHKHYKIIIAVSVGAIFTPVKFLGVGLILHLCLDSIEAMRH